jgi:hypothetical protein
VDAMATALAQHSIVSQREAWTEESVRQKETLQMQLNFVMLRIADHTDKKRDHLPPVVAESANLTVPYQWEVSLPKSGGVPGLDTVKRMLSQTAPPPMSL